MQPLTKCQGFTIFGITLLLIIGTTFLRTSYHLLRGSVHAAEIGIDLSAGALALAVSVSLEAACHWLFPTQFPVVVAVKHQSQAWVFAVPLLPAAALQANSWLLSTAVHSKHKYEIMNHLPAMAAILLGIVVLVIASGFQAVRTGCHM